MLQFALSISLILLSGSILGGCDEMLNMENLVRQMDAMLMRVHVNQTVKSEESILFFGKDGGKLDTLIKRLSGHDLKKLPEFVDKIIPHQVYNPTTDLSLFACPIEQTTHDAVDLLASYFTVEIAQKSNQIKLAVVAEMNNKENLKEVMMKLAKFLVQPSLYNNSIVFVVTECPSTANSYKQSVIRDLNKIKDELLTLGTSTEEQSGRNAYKAMGETLQQILSSPEKHIVLVTRSSSNLEEIIKTNSYMVPNRDHFSYGWKISDNFIQTMKNTLHNLENEFCPLAMQLNETMLRYVESMIDKPKINSLIINNELTDLETKLTDDLAELASEEESTPSLFIKYMLKLQPYIVNYRDQLMMRKIMQNTLVWNLFSFFYPTDFSFMSSCIRDVYNNILVNVIRLLITVQSHIDKLLPSYDGTLMDYELHELVEQLKFNIKPSPVSWRFSEKKNTNINLKDTLLLKLVKSRYEAVKMLVSTSYCLKEFNGETLIIRKNVISTSEIAQTLRTHKLCKEHNHDKITHDVDIFPNCASQLKHIQVFAFQRIVIDSDVTVVGASLTIIAPVWDAQDEVTITMQGEDGESFPPAVSISGERVDGKAGRPGGSAGHFLGVGERFFSMPRVTVASIGGRGGNGQDGADGMNGIDSPEIIYTEISHVHSYLIFHSFDTSSNCNNMHKYYDIGCSFCPLNGGLQHPKYKDTYLPLSIIKTMTDIENIKPPADIATRGEVGGNGGVPGSGGISGKIKIINIRSEAINFNTLYTPGTNGNCGKAGKGGRGGRKYSYFYCKEKIFFSNKNQKYVNLDYKYAGDIKGGSESDGLDGKACSHSDLINPTPPSANTYNLIQALENYKFEAYEQLGTDLKIHAARTFIDKIKKNEDLQNEYNVDGVAGAFLNLEYRTSNMVQQKRDVIFTMFDYLNDRILELNSSDTTSIFLKNALKTKLFALRNYDFTPFIVNFRGYLQTIIDTVQEHSEAQELFTIHETKKEFSKGLATKIAEAYAMVDSQVSKKIDKDMDSLKEQVMNFIKKLASKEADVEANVADLERQKKQMQEMAIYNVLFSVLSMVSRFVSLLGPIGAVVGGIGSMVADIGSTVVDGSIDTAVPLDVGTLNNRIDLNLDEIRESSDLEIEANILLETAVEYDKKSAASIKELLNAIANERQKPIPDVAQIESLEEKLKETMENTKTPGEKIMQTLEEHKVPLYGRIYLFFAEKILVDNDATKELAKQIVEGRKTAVKLKRYRGKIERTITPVLQTMRADFKQNVASLRNEDTMTLIIRNWNIRTVLREMKIKLREMLVAIDNVDVRDSIAGYIDLLEDTMNTMVKIYDQVEAYKDQKQMIELIADVNKARTSAQNSHIPLEPVVLQVYSMIKKNAMDMEYNMFMQQFLQHTFPLAEYYLADQQPFSVGKENITLLSNEYLNNMRTLQKRLNNLDTVISEQIDTILGYVVFEKTTSSETKPFYTWLYEQEKEKINHLLAGDEVLLFADITQSMMDMTLYRQDAIKFTKISLNLRARDPNYQRELEQLLRSVTVQLTHMGNSYYKCADKIYLFVTEPQEFSFSYKEECNQNDFGSSAFEKIKRGDATLSPYTYWKMQLFCENSNVLQRLAAFTAKTSVDVDLTGKGVIIMGNHEQTCDQYNINKYYSQYEVVNFHNQNSLRTITITEHSNLLNTIDSMVKLNQWHISERDLPAYSYYYFEPESYKCQF